MMVVFPGSHNPMLSAKHPSGSGNPPPPACSQSIFAEVPGGRRTNVFSAVDAKVPLAEYEGVATRDFNDKLRSARSVNELLEHFHAEGDLLGVRFILKGLAVEGSRVRFTFLDTGSRLPKAETVNDLLKATYDALEVHRTELVQRNVLHRDMSVYNILMYPGCGSMNGPQVNKNSPPTVQDVLFGQNRPVEDRFPACLVIDYDNAALLDDKVTKPQELMQRTGTPMYISRSLCTGQVLTDFGNRLIPSMPELSEKPRKLYVSAHGEARYARYNDTKSTRHGACPPDLEEFDAPRAFCHRPEHDVESIYWSMVSALLNVRPKGVEEEPDAADAFDANWNNLLRHKIPDNRSFYTDPRELTLKQTEQAWRAQFLGDMKDVGTLLFNISRQIRPEYAFFADDLQQDHLHEAVQRLILQYLADHDDIPLDPDYLRPIPQPQKPTVTRPSKRVTTKGSGAGSGVKRATRRFTRASENRGMSSATKRKFAARDSAQSDQGAGPSTSGARAGAVPNAIIVDPRRKSSSQTGRSSKRLRNNSGLPQSIEECGESDT